MSRILLILSLYVICVEINAWHFHNHRHRSFLLETDQEWPDMKFTQILDHFNPIDERTWKQHYMVRDDFYNSSVGDHAFLYIGGEGPMSQNVMSINEPLKYAQNYQGILFQLEHRYYGNSFPLPATSVENLRYLTAGQALADLANFIQAMNAEYKLKNPKWIAVGGSYAGNLAAWLRSKYPHLVAGAVSASGPVLAQVDYPEYLNTVEIAIDTHSSQCADLIRESTQELDELFETAEGRKNITKLFHLCDQLATNLDDPDTVAYFYGYIADYYAAVVQYNRDSVAGDNGIDAMCRRFDNLQGTPLERVAQILVGIECEMPGHNWNFQVCTEFGYLQTSSKNSIFGEKNPVKSAFNVCRQYFPDMPLQTLNDRINVTNLDYGGLHPEVTNVVFINGGLDPWHRLSIIKDLNDKSPAIVIRGASHCTILSDEYPGEAVPDDMPAAKAKVMELIGEWLKEY